MNRKKQFKVYISNNSINKNKSTNPLVHLKYRQLQELAIKLMLPANIKYKLLLALIIARTSNREDIVDVITRQVLTGKKSKLSEYKNGTNQQDRASEVNEKGHFIESKRNVDGNYNSSDASNLSSASTASCSTNGDDTRNDSGGTPPNYLDLSGVDWSSLQIGAPINLNVDQAAHINFENYILEDNDVDWSEVFLELNKQTP